MVVLLSMISFLVSKWFLSFLEIFLLLLLLLLPSFSNSLKFIFFLCYLPILSLSLFLLWHSQPEIKRLRSLMICAFSHVQKQRNTITHIHWICQNIIIIHYIYIFIIWLYYTMFLNYDYIWLYSIRDSLHMLYNNIHIESESDSRKWFRCPKISNAILYRFAYFIIFSNYIGRYAISL